MKRVSQKKKLGIIGYGNMGQAIVKGLITTRYARPSELLVWDSETKKRRALKQAGLKCAGSNEEVVQHCSIVLLAVKPQQMKAVVQEMSPFLRTSGPLLISIAAGLSTSWIEKHAGRKVPVVRVMPNTPALVQKGMSALARGKFATDRHGRAAENIFKRVGAVVHVPEKLMNAVTAVSGSGPAYFFFLIEQLIKEAVSLGLPVKTARKLAVETAQGAAALAVVGDPADLRKKVTSKGGTTAAALEVFKQQMLPKASARVSGRLTGEQGNWEDNNVCIRECVLCACADSQFDLYDLHLDDYYPDSPELGESGSP